MTKLSWEKFEPLFGNWASKFKPFFDKGGFDSIYEYLKDRAKLNHRIAPVSSLVWRAFKETDINNIKVIIIGLSPYHTFVNNVSICDGLALSCSITKKMQPSLKTLVEAWQKECYNGISDKVKNPDLSYLAAQNILLINAALTTEMGKVDKHLPIWEPFMKYLLEEVVGYTGIPIIFLGNEATKLQKYVTPFTHMFFLKHPSYYARIDQEMETNGVFNKVNQIIRENNGKEFEIKWLCTEEEIEQLILPF